jgi:ATP-dependent DNA helicase HFM1/MER3
LVIVKGTKGWTDNGCQEYADLEMMQMLGRAGRPQFEQSACAIILTQNERVDYYNRLGSGQEPLESCLHINLLDHLNAEIGLGTVFDLSSAKRWLASTFLFVRLGKNADHYRLKEDVTSRNDDELLGQICSKDVTLLQEADLVTSEARLNCTEFGHVMARYSVKFDTMKILLSLPPKAKLSEIVSRPRSATETKLI